MQICGAKKCNKEPLRAPFRKVANETELEEKSLERGRKGHCRELHMLSGGAGEKIQIATVCGTGADLILSSRK